MVPSPGALRRFRRQAILKKNTETTISDHEDRKPSAHLIRDTVYRDELVERERLLRRIGRWVELDRSVRKRVKQA